LLRSARYEKTIRSSSLRSLDLAAIARAFSTGERANGAQSHVASLSMVPLIRPPERRIPPDPRMSPRSGSIHCSAAWRSRHQVPGDICEYARIMCTLAPYRAAASPAHMLGLRGRCQGLMRSIRRVLSRAPIDSDVRSDSASDRSAEILCNSSRAQQLSCQGESISGTRLGANAGGTGLAITSTKQNSKSP
jgi:hypothetical protein